MVHNPKVGDMRADIIPLNSGRFIVVFKIFKFDSIRQDAYWVTKTARPFSSRKLAEAYISRLGISTENK